MFLWHGPGLSRHVPNSELIVIPDSFSNLIVAQAMSLHGRIMTLTSHRSGDHHAESKHLSRVCRHRVSVRHGRSLGILFMELLPYVVS